MTDANASQNDFLLKTFFEKERWEAASQITPTYRGESLKEA